MKRPVIIGAGLAGLSAAIELARRGIACDLVSRQVSERAQSVLAEGGINAALDAMGEGDTPELHYEDTVRAGCDLADPQAVRNLAEQAPEIVRELADLGVPFHRSNGQIVQRNFGGQKKKRTAYAASSTGKAISTALIDEARKWEAAGLIRRYAHHDFLELLLVGDEESKATCAGARIADNYTGKETHLHGPVILCCGGLAGLFPGQTTGTTQNTGDAAARLFSQGVVFSNLEMIQYHPTTFAIPGKRCLISEAARGEGGRLFVIREGRPWYFMEELYPELGNLMPRDVVSREMTTVVRREDCENQVYLDLTGIEEAVWEESLSDMREEIRDYLGIDPAGEPVPVEPGIHYFMGGIHVDAQHRTNIRDLYAAGECCSAYHGANRLGGNSMLGAILGGRTAAGCVADILRPNPAADAESATEMEEETGRTKKRESSAEVVQPAGIWNMDTTSRDRELGAVLRSALGIERSEAGLVAGLDALAALEKTAESERDRERIRLARAMLFSANLRRESRGAHFRTDYPKRDEALCAPILAHLAGEDITVEVSGS